MMSLPIKINQEEIGAFCRKNGMRKLFLYGSVLRDDFQPDSDVDVLVEFEPGRIPDFFQFIHIEDELSALLEGRKVDLVTEKFLNIRIRADVIDKAELLYG